MNKRLLETNKELSKEINKDVKSFWKRMSDIGSKLLKNRELTLANIEELEKRIAEKQNYESCQLIVCDDEIKLSEELYSHKNKIDDKPIFIIFRNEQKSLATFCIVERQNTVTCLIKNFSLNQTLETIKNVVNEKFDKNVVFKVHPEVTNLENGNDQDALCLKTLETMMVHLKSDKKEKFIENFENPKETYFRWLKNGSLNLKNELFSLVKEGYYSATASDIDQLSRDAKFKEAIKKLIDKIPQPEDVEPFKKYQTLLKEFTEKVANVNDIDSDEMKQRQIELDQARKRAFSKVENKELEFFKNQKSDQQFDVVKAFPNQMEKFTRIFEPLVFIKVDEKFDEELKRISSKLDLEYEKLKIYFNFKEEEKVDHDDTTTNIININDVISRLPSMMVEDANQSTMNKTIEQLFAEIVVENSNTLNIESLIISYMKVKYFYKLWSSEKDAKKIHEWAVSKRGKLTILDIYEAVAVLDKANELVTGGHKLRDTQILSVLMFLQQTDRGQLLQIQTGEGKTTIISVLAAIKALQGEKVDVITSNPVLAADGVRVKEQFYKLLNLTAATNNLDENYKSGPRDCYKADIVYGNISNFQFDYLKDSFLGLNTRAERPLQSVILDEVDSMIIDNASHIAKLSEHLPGMENLKYIYIKIWQELHKAEQKITRAFGERLKLKAEIIEQFSPSDGMNKSSCELLLKELKRLVIPEIKKSIKQVEPTKIDIILSHIQEYADTSLDRWIDSAIDAKFIYHEDEQYVIRKKNNEKVIQPVDYANTGVTLKNTIWQHGLHQFLQLKHNLQLTSESLTSCFISNLCYINKYGNQIYGLTGTLGSEAEQKLLSSLYNVELANIPTYRKKKFIELESKIVDDETFSMEIAENVIAKVKQRRAVLVICETIKDAKAIQEVLSESNITKTFFDEDHAHVTEENVEMGDVVIATNIAGRGTDFKTSALLESNKGLHVCVAFLPCNKRVEDQAFGRTARQGNNGSGQLVIKKSVMDNLGINPDFFKDIKKLRDKRERNRLKLIQDIKVPELKFQDKLFERFSTLYKKLQEEFECKRELKFVLDDLKEFWAFWLNKLNFEDLKKNKKNVDDKDLQLEVDQVFQDFHSKAVQVIKGEIKFNPYYSIQQAEFFLSSNNKLEEAEKSLKHALEISNNPEILHSAFMKLFEISIEKGGIFINKFKEAVGDVFLIPKSFLKLDLEYKQNARKYLKKARKAFEKEFNYIRNLFEDKEFPSILISDINVDANQPQPENLFLKHIVSKQQALSLIMNHVNNFICKIDELKNGLSISSRIPDYLSNLEPKNDHEKKIKNIITSSELTELAANGSNITYALREIHNVCPEIVKAAQVQIGVGIGLIAVGFIFPPALFITSPIGATMITEGICDIALELINKNSDGKFDVKSYIKSKVISYSISLFTKGVCAALECPKILEKAKLACRWFAETLRKCPCLKNAFEFVASKFDKLADWFEKMENIAKFNCMTKMEKLKYAESLDSKSFKCVENVYQDLLKELQDFGVLREITHFEKCVSTLEQVTANIGINVTRTVENAIMKKILDSSINDFQFKVQNNVTSKATGSVRKHPDEKVPDLAAEVITNKINEFLVSVVYKFMKQLFKDIFHSVKTEILVSLFGVLVFWLLYTFC